MIKCSICGQPTGPNAMRMGICWDCIEAESIISEGLDMYDKGLADDNTPTATPMDKVRLLVKCGIIKSV